MNVEIIITTTPETRFIMNMERDEFVKLKRLARADEGKQIKESERYIERLIDLELLASDKAILNEYFP